MLWRPHQSGLLDDRSSFFFIRRDFFTSSFTNKMIGNHQQDDDFLCIAKNGKVAFGWLQHIIFLMHILIAKGYHILNVNPYLCLPGAGYFSYSIFADWKAARTVTSLNSAVSLLSLTLTQQLLVWFCFNSVCFEVIPRLCEDIKHIFYRQRIWSRNWLSTTYEDLMLSSFSEES